MAFTDIVAAKATTNSAKTRVTAKFGQPDVNTLEGLKSFAATKGVDIAEKKPGILTRGVAGAFDILQAPSKLVGGLIAQDTVRLPSEALFGKSKEFDSLGASLKYQFTTGDGLKRFAADVLLDPLTYLTLGTSAGIKVLTTAGARVVLSKAGKELLEELAGEIVEKGAGRIAKSEAVKIAKQQVGKIVTAPKTIEQAGGLPIIKRALAKEGKKVTAESVKEFLQKGSTKLVEKPSIKFAGVKLAELPKAGEMISSIAESLKGVPHLKPLVEGIEKTGQAMGRLFSRDFGLPEEFRITKQKFIDSYDASVSRIKNNLKVIFAGTTSEQRIAITKAIESGTIHTLDQETRKLAVRVKSIFASIAKEEEKRGLLNNTLEDYVTHIYKNKEKAKTLIQSVRAGQPSALLRFAKTRMLPNLEEAKALGLDPIEDISEILSLRLMASEKAKLTQDFIGNVVQQYGTPKNILGVKHIFIPPKFREILKTTKIPVSAGEKLAKEVSDLLPKELLGDRTSLAAVDEGIKILSNQRDEIRTAIRSAERNIQLSGSRKALEFLGKKEALAFQRGQIKLLKETQSKLDELLSTLAELRKTPKTEEVSGFVKVKTSVLDFKPAREVIKNIKKQNPELANQLLSAQDQFVRFSDAVTGIPGEIKNRNIFIPANIAQDIASMGKRFFSDESVNMLLRGYDKALNFFKGSVTVLFPAFHSRNALSNVMLNFLDIGQSAFNPLTHKMSLEILTGAEGKLVNDLGEEISYSQIRKLMKENQIFQDTLARTDIGRIVDPTVLQKMSPFEAGRLVGRSIENEARLVNFITNLRRGFDPADAANRTKQFLFDYDNLSLFEKDVMRRLIPFYTFTRKNIALQLRELVKQPGKQATMAKAFNTINEMFGKDLTDEEKQFTPEFIADGLNILLSRKDDDRTFLVGFDLPLEDAIQKVSEFIENPFKAFLNQTAPFIKVPFEIATGKNLFTEKEIADDDNGNFAKNLPQAVKNWMEFSEKEVTTKDGKTFILQKVNPKKKFVWRNVTALTGLGRFTAASTLDGSVALYHLFTGDKIDIQAKGDILRLFTGLTLKTTGLQGEKKRQEKVTSEKIIGELERKGTEVPSFEKRFIPKTGSKLQSKLK